MTPTMLLADLTARGIELRADGDKLRFQPVNLVTPDEVDALRQHKSAILKLLQAEGQQAAEMYCCKHHDPSKWTYLPDKYKRPGWRSVYCEFCRTFIGYQQRREK